MVPSVRVNGQCNEEDTGSTQLKRDMRNSTVVSFSTLKCVRSHSTLVCSTMLFIEMKNKCDVIFLKMCYRPACNGSLFIAGDIHSTMLRSAELIIELRFPFCGVLYYNTGDC